MNSITLTVLLDPPFWIGVFESEAEAGYSVARKVFGSEPTNPELYEFVLKQLGTLKFSNAHELATVIVKKKKFKRMQRNVRKTLAKLKLRPETHAQEAMREQLEESKKVRKQQSKQEKETAQIHQFALKQAKKKQKHRGH